MPIVETQPEVLHTTTVLIVWTQPTEYDGVLRSRFPELEILTATDFAAAERHFEPTDILVTDGFGLTPEMVERMPRLRWIQCLMSGTDQLAAARSARPEMLVTSCRGMHGPQMAEMALLHMLALSRGIVQTERNRVKREWVAPEQRSLDGKTVTIVGMGVAGARLAGLCKALGMTVLGVSRSDRPVAGVNRMFKRDELLDAVGHADHVVLALALDDDTRGLFNASVFDAMKPTAFIVNIARGGLIDEPALIEALRSGDIAGAGLDVSVTEPPQADNPQWDMENVFLTPHLAGRSDRYAEQALAIVEPNLRHYLAGRSHELRNMVPLPVEPVSAAAS